MTEQSVLISIQPKWVEKILNGEKTLEVRKSKPRLEVPFKRYIYCTKVKNKDCEANFIYFYKDENGFICDENGNKFTAFEIGTVVAEFICDDIYSLAPLNHAPQNVDVEKESCLTREEIVKYLGGKGYAWHISDLVVYDKPKELSEFSAVCRYADTDNDNNCFGCKYFWHESNESIGYDSWCACDGIKPLNRPPQIWCYVDGTSAGSTN